MTSPRPLNVRPAPHYWRASPDDRSGHTCVHCPLGRRHAVHDPVKVALHRQEVGDRQHEHAARYEPQDLEDE